MSIRTTLACLLFFAVACGDDSATGGNGGSPSTGGGDVGGAPPTGGAPETGGGGPTSDGGNGAGGGEGGGPSACDSVPAGPFVPVLATDQFSGSEDFVFDGSGGIIGKDGGQVVRVDASDAKTTVAALPDQAFGIRYDAAGALFVALPGAGELVKIEGSDVTPFLAQLDGPNGVYGDFDGNVWVTEFGGDRVIRVSPDASAEAIVDGAPASSPNGIVYDADRDVVFFTNYGQGRIYRVDPAGASAPIEVATIQGTALDGLVLDACGHIYAVDNQGDRLYRVQLDAEGAATGEPELLAELDSSVANAQFGSGDGWNATSLYVGGGAGSIYEVPVGVAGAPVPTAAE